jgi:hypothetical protein
MTDFKQVQASVFQVARAPGRTSSISGALLLILGIFAMLYVRERRLWVWLTPDGRADGHPKRGRHAPRWRFSSQPQDHGQRPRIRAPEAQAARGGQDMKQETR